MSHARSPISTPGAYELRGSRRMREQIPANVQARGWADCSGARDGGCGVHGKSGAWVCDSAATRRLRNRRRADDQRSWQAPRCSSSPFRRLLERRLRHCGDQAAGMMSRNEIATWATTEPEPRSPGSTGRSSSPPCEVSDALVTPGGSALGTYEFDAAHASPPSPGRRGPLAFPQETFVTYLFGFAFSPAQEPAGEERRAEPQTSADRSPGLLQRRRLGLIRCRPLGRRTSSPMPRPSPARSSAGPLRVFWVWRALDLGTHQ